MGQNSYFSALAAGRRIAVLGMGVTGLAVARFFSKNGIAFTAHDCNPLAGGGEFAIASTFFPNGSELVIYSPGLLHSPWLNLAKKMGCHCLGELDLAQLFHANPTIAVTGTNGKTSTVTMLAALLFHAGRRFRATGNLGHAAIDAVPTFAADANLWNLCEVSSFQAHGLRHMAPRHVLWTNFAENHRDLHPSLEDYFFAKWNLLERCQETAFVGEDVADWAKFFGQSLPANAIICPAWEGKCDHPFLQMAHQRENFSLVLALGQHLGWDIGWILDAMMANLQPPPYRLFRPILLNNWELWNDSKATNAAAVLRALDQVQRPGIRTVWITGGSSKGESWKNFLPIIRRVDHVLCFGGVGEWIAALAGPGKAELLPTASALFPRLRQLASNGGGGTALFSPGFASFDLFLGYAERGRWFDGGVAGAATVDGEIS
ncbi:MAG: UDP-N-acetylmuramoyl-L-alanine--D-glutamate ligase [Puniceicoccales bacterium]|jgi:UDP-N-acetylmuramoylalanine--D-glutamate ligase|nr:UDP-N-acetylmuramoyl-L-alanine--D-glutamate ligase [Puniceicoccales bacterium]